MALPMRRPTSSSPDPHDPPAITPLADDADYGREIAILAALQRREERRQQELDRLGLEGHFSAKPSGASDGPRDSSLRARLVKLRALPDYFASESTDPAPTAIPAAALARGLELLRGGTAKPEMTRQERLDRLRLDGLILDEAIQFQAGIVDELRSEKSRLLALSLKAHHDAVLLALYRALQEASGLVDRERQFRGAMIVNGYEIYGEIVHPPFITAPLLLGSELHHDSQISTWRRHLQAQGVVS